MEIVFGIFMVFFLWISLNVGRDEDPVFLEK